ncbi:MAG: RNA methyltransferase, partial [Anaerolineaceae bacterium]|nr:RNA methyltransferase [Anaerolineaceae bacterium]
IILPIAHTALITPAVVNASSGASEHLLIGQYNLAQAIKEIKTHDAWVIGLDEDERSLPPEQIDLNMGIAIVVGNEGQGLRNLVAKSCDHLMKLPMYGRIGSLNAAVAGSIALYLARQARVQAPIKP